MIGLPDEMVSLTLARPRVLIAGASTRAAAFAAIRCGFEPVCIDQFADSDLRALAEVHPIENLALAPDQEPLRGLTDLPIVFTGGMENHRATWEAIEASRTLLASPSSAVAQVRDPFALAAGLNSLKQATLELCSATAPPPADGMWMLKPLASAGGRGVRVWDETAAAAREMIRSTHFFQRRVGGPVHSALFVASQEVGDVRFVGLTRQWAGCPELHAREFGWCGNIGPISLDLGAEALVRRWGNILKWKFGLTGLFGIDFALDEAGRPWLLEVNPRWTGSAEVLDLACGLSLFADHVGCYSAELGMLGRELSQPVTELSGPLVGRAILYANQPLQWTSVAGDPVTADGLPELADIPEPGSRIESGQPVCSLYAAGSDADLVQADLFEKSRRVLAERTRPAL